MKALVLSLAFAAQPIDPDGSGRGPDFAPIRRLAEEDPPGLVEREPFHAVCRVHDDCDGVKRNHMFHERAILRKIAAAHAAQRGNLHCVDRVRSNDHGGAAIGERSHTIAG